jgi:hypothetical protein
MRQDADELELMLQWTEYLQHAGFDLLDLGGSKSQCGEANVRGMLNSLPHS